MALLTSPGSTSVPIPTARHTWPKHTAVKDSFWKKGLRHPIEARLAFECLSSGSTESESVESSDLLVTISR